MGQEAMSVPTAAGEEPGSCASGYKSTENDIRRSATAEPCNCKQAEEKHKGTGGGCNLPVGSGFIPYTCIFPLYRLQLKSLLL